MSVNQALQLACEGKEQVNPNFVKELIAEKNYKGDEINGQWLCQICSDVVQKPSKCDKCETLFCSDCICSWLKEDPILKVEKVCPNCRGPFESSKITRIEL